jgi:NAD(P)H-hydrate epimerase
MKRTISAKEAQAFDGFAQEQFGIPSIVLMENAGRGVAEEGLGMGRALGGGEARFVVRSACPERSRGAARGTQDAFRFAHRLPRAEPRGGRLPLYAAVICGTGNNGGDGFVAARHLLNAGLKVKVFVVGSKSKLKRDPKINLNILLKMGQGVKWVKSVKDLKGIEKCGLIIDAIFGIGLNSPVKGIFLDAINALNNSGVPILSVDVPSGFNVGTAVRPRRTVTFVAAKKGMAPKYCGKIVVKDIGIGLCKCLMKNA